MLRHGLHPRDAHRDAERSGRRGRRSEFQDHSGRRRTWPQRRPAGDLYITCTVRPHKIFKRDRYDLYCDVPISFTQAALGGEIDVPTLGGTTKYNIPAGTQEGTSFRIRGEGIQQMRGTNRGDLFFTVHVEVPKHLGEKQKELLRQFEDSLNGREYERRKSFGDQVKSYIRDNAERFKEKFEKK